ncbi:hypothetical protein [Streptococcus sp. sy004]|uniref:hypothetical protein n=1 Tax=Streptococcus sp. sy004 TaxID=2600149 RepID=UPI0021BD3841|nr:hypothetical protein [Streptococcus sp. sy004]
MKRLNALALYSDEKTLAFWQNIQTYFDDLLQLTISSLDDFTQNITNTHQAIFSTSTVETELPLLILNSAEHPWQIARQIRQFIDKQTQELLNYLPLRLTIFDEKGHVLYSNGQPDGSFFFADDVEPLESWILSDIKTSQTDSLHLPIPLDSFNQRLIQTYQALYDDQKKLRGIFQYTQDISPLLKAYLDDSGQALVGWSDVTSGASISNQDDN